MTTLEIWLIGALIAVVVFGALNDHMDKLLPQRKSFSSAQLVYLAVIWPISVASFLAGVIIGLYEIKKGK